MFFGIDAVLAIFQGSVKMEPTLPSSIDVFDVEIMPSATLDLRGPSWTFRTKNGASGGGDLSFTSPEVMFPSGDGILQDLTVRSNFLDAVMTFDCETGPMLVLDVTEDVTLNTSLAVSLTTTFESITSTFGTQITANYLTFRVTQGVSGPTIVLVNGANFILNGFISFGLASVQVESPSIMTLATDTDIDVSALISGNGNEVFFLFFFFLLS